MKETDRQEAVFELATSYVWRLEVDEYQASGFMTVLMALGYLTSADVTVIMDELYPKREQAKADD